uniref:Uncharacterized protein n=1 Tax=Xiphophorus couchianus TaxID=32473 RepID=A0A3B5M0D9_9TELE
MRSGEFKQNREPKHTSKLVLESIKEEKIILLEWIPKSSKLLGKCSWLKASQPIKLNQLCQEDWSNIQPDL